MSNLVHNARIKLQARFYCNLGLLIFGICLATPVIHPGLSDPARSIIFGGGLLFMLVTFGGSYLALGRLKD
jgi:hypothetical protein